MNRTCLPWLCVVVLLMGSAAGLQAAQTALDEYVARPDSTYRYELVRTVHSDDGAGYVLNMVSQTWRSPDEVDRTEWQHWVLIAVPRVVRHDTALLIIDGGRNGGDPPSGIDGGTAALAVRTGSVVAHVKIIPNQPLRFTGEDRDRYEDDTIAYTWDRFLRTGDADWPLQLPMVKSAVRAMDTVQDFVRKLTGNVNVEGFVVTGASKRGWTTWLTAAVDRRVVAIAPIVIDMLNTQPSFQHHRAVYGFYAPAVRPYEEMGIFARIETPEAEKLMAIVDPFSYRERLAMPKFILVSAGDQFFLPDSWRFYYRDLLGPKRLRYVPNCGHGLKDTDALETLQMFYQSVIEGWPLPEYEFDSPRPGTIRVTCTQRPSQVRLWQATNPQARDFRVDTFGKEWASTPLGPESDGSYIGRVDRPEKGFTAFFVELTFPSPGPDPYTFTTGVYIIPDIEPFARP